MLPWIHGECYTFWIEIDRLKLRKDPHIQQCAAFPHFSFTKTLTLANTKQCAALHSIPVLRNSTLFFHKTPTLANTTVACPTEVNSECHPGYEMAHGPTHSGVQCSAQGSSFTEYNDALKLCRLVYCVNSVCAQVCSSATASVFGKVDGGTPAFLIVAA